MLPHAAADGALEIMLSKIKPLLTMVQAALEGVGLLEYCKLFLEKASASGTFCTSGIRSIITESCHFELPSCSDDSQTSHQMYRISVFASN